MKVLNVNKNKQTKLDISSALSPYLSGNSVFLESTSILAQQLCKTDQEMFVFYIFSLEFNNLFITLKCKGFLLFQFTN